MRGPRSIFSRRIVNPNDFLVTFKININPTVQFLLLLLPVCLISSTAFGQNQLTRTIIVEEALIKSRIVKTQQLEVKKTIFDKQKARLIYLPNVYFNASYTHLNDDIVFSVPPINIDLSPIGALMKLPPGSIPPMTKTLDPIVLQKQDIFKADVTATMVLFSGLKSPRLGLAASYKEKAERELIEKEKTTVIAECLGYYDKIALINQSLIVLEESSRRLDKQSAFAQKAFNAGLVSSYDLNKIRIALQEIKSKRIELNGQRKLVLSKLNQLTGIPSDSLSIINVDLKPWRTTFAEKSVTDRPEAKALEAAEKAVLYKKRAEVSDYLPQVIAFGKRELRIKDLISCWKKGLKKVKSAKRSIKTL